MTSELPQSLQDAAKRPPSLHSLKDIRHVVFLMQENRSFDHYFGKGLGGVRGQDDRNLVTLPDGQSVLDQPDQDSAVPVVYRPYQIKPGDAIKEPRAHDWNTGHEAWNDGRYDQWIMAKGGITMGYLDQPEVVGLYQDLAKAFTICDAYHASVMGETSSNRNYLFSGFGGWEPKGDRVTGAEAHDREDPDADVHEEDRKPGYNWPSYPEILEVNNDPFGSGTISWKVYQGCDNFYDNNLEFHEEFKRISATVLKEAGYPHTISLYDYYQPFVKAMHDAMEKNDPAGIDKAKKAYRAAVVPLDNAAADSKTLSATDKSLYRRGLARHAPPLDMDNPEGYADFVYEFFKDVSTGNAPRVSYLVPAEPDSEHPGSSTPRDGEKVVKQVLDVIARRPDMWESTVLFISYDENDGFFDHMPPPVPRPEVEDEYAQRGGGPKWPIGLGNRVPMIVVSPWTVGGYVNSQVFDHTSQVRFLEEWLGVRQPAISRWRRTVAGDLTSVFDFGRTGDKPKQPTDPTRRLARPLPYQVDVHGALHRKSDGTSDAVALSMSNTGSSTGKASAHVTLYAYQVFEKPQHFDVLGAPAEPFSVPLKNGAYDFYLTGPNGFRREFAGTSAGAAAKADLTTAIGTDPASPRALTLTLTTAGTTPLNVTVTSRHYQEPAQSKSGKAVQGAPFVISWDTQGTDGWYDLDVSIAEDKEFRRRLMGHIEDGRPSITG
ncbi:alkaline phosphatase family protein [Kitasatospora sp. NPDC089509]|uniref:alkaline phosphatase family protein n=1 Tax=Kitasatospora sp. NPDC089509 TaxID=3364079 RepID=UPI0038259186